jgi:hypothetical protein
MIDCRRRVAGTIARGGHVVRRHILLRCRALIHGAVHWRVADTALCQCSAVDRTDGRV